MIQDFSKIYDKMLEEQTKKSTIVPLIKEEPSGVKNIVNEKPKEEPLEKFLLSLNEKLKQKQKEKQELEEKIKKKQELEEQLKQNQISPIKEVVDNSLIQDSEENLDNNTENNLEEVEKVEDLDEIENFYIKELEKIDKSSSKKLIKENEELSNQIQQLQTQITRLNVEAGTWGGGDIGGGGSGSRGSGDCDCTTDRLISGDQTLILNSDGTISFPNDVITTPTGLINVFGDLSATGRIYQNGNDLQSEIESISATTKSVYTTVNTNSAYWSDVYTTFKNASSTFLTSETDSQTLSFNDLNKNLTISNGNTISLSSLIPDTSVRALTSNWQSTYTTVSSNSATWNYQGTDIKALTSGWVGGNSAYTTVLANSASWAVDSTLDSDVRALTSTWVGGNQAYTNLISNSAAYLSGVNLSFLSVSGNWNSVYTTVSSNSANWNYQGTDIKALTSGWVGGNSAYTTVLANSASWAVDSSVDTGVRALTSTWVGGNQAYTTVQSNSANWNYQGTDIKALTSGWVGGNQAYTTVQSNSANWNYQGTDIKALTSGWVGGNQAYTNLISNSAAYLSGADLSFLSVSGNWNSTYSTVQSNSANWNYQGTDIKALTGNWNNTSNIVQSNSSQWASNVDTNVRALTSNWENTYTTFKNASSTFLTSETDSQTLSFNDTLKTLSISNGNTISLSSLVDSTSIDTSVRALTSNWQSTYTTVSSNSATWNYQGTDIKALTSGWVGGNSAYTNLISNSAAYLSSVDLSFLSVSGNWNSVYTTVSSNSATWNYDGTDIKALTSGWVGGNSAYTTVLANSASWAVDSSVDTDVRLLTSDWVGGNQAYTNLISNSAAYLSGVDLSFLSVSGNWDSTYSTVNANSANWNYQGTDIKELTGNWQEAYTNISTNSAAYLSSVDLSFLSVSGNWDSTYTTVSSNSATWSSSYTILQANSATWSSGVLGTSETLIAEVKNAESITLNRGDVVYAFGSTGNKLSVKLASNLDDTTSSKTIGVVNGTIAAGGTGFITSVGRMDQLALGSFNDGDSLWLDSTAGDFTNVKPIQPRHGVFIGIVERANNGDGIAYIKIQNGYELNEIHDVLVTNVSAGDFLQRNSSNTLWVPVPLSANEWNLTYSIVQSNSSNWNLGGTGGSELSALSGNWQDVSTLVRNNSASWSAGVSGVGINDPLKFKFISDGITNTYSVSGTNNSSNAAYIDVYVENVKQEPFDSYTLSSDVVTFTTTPEENTEIIIITPNVKFYSSTPNLLSNLNIQNNNSDISPLTANWQSTYTTVSSNSATWNYDGTDIKALTADWVGGNQAYTNLISNSAAYLSGSDLSFLSVSGNWNSVYTTVSSNSATWGTGTMVGSDVSGLSANWESVYSTVQANSSVNWNYDGTDIKALTADWVGGNEAYTTVLANSASWGSGGGIILPDGNSFGEDILIGSNDAYKLTFETNNTPRMTILSGGNVGINTQTPNKELTIVGSISTTDYIFHRTKLDFVTNTSHTFNSSNQSSLVLFNSVIPVSSYVPSDANSNFDIGYNFNLATLNSIVYVYGQAGVTITAADDRNYLRTKGSTATLVKVGSNSWLLFGDIWKDGL